MDSVREDKYDLDDVADISFLQFQAENDVATTFLDEY